LIKKQKVDASRPLKTIYLLGGLWRELSFRHHIAFYGLILLMGVTSISELIGIGALLPFLSALVSPKILWEHEKVQLLANTFNITSSDEILFLFTLLFVVCAIFSGFCRLLLMWAQITFSNSVGAKLSIEVFRRTLYQPYILHISRNSSQVIASVSGKVNSVISGVVMPSLNILSGSLMLLVILSTYFILQPKIAAITFIVLIGIYGSIMVFTRERLKTDGNRINKEMSRVIKILQEGLGGIRDIILDGTQEVFCAAYANSDTPMRKAQSRIQMMIGAPRFIIEALGISFIAILAFLLQTEDSNTSIIPLLGTLALGVQRLFPAIQLSFASWSQIKASQAVMLETLDFLSQEIEISSQNPVLTQPILFTKSLEFKSVGFRYGNGLPSVFENLNFVIQRGSRVGIIGKTGCGKSTLLDILMGLVEPSDGAILIDGVVLTKMNIRLWQARLSHVPQHIFLADATIAENIAFGVNVVDIDMGRVVEAAKKAKIHTVIMDMKLGYQEIIGERGIRLSGGQRQRLGIARALYKNADILVLDEATSALDSATESEVMSEIEQLEDITIIMVSHRQSTLKSCHQFIDLTAESSFKLP
jgi:ABC-type bacteriocin/lantibiotic exporter with double-glycine peptidase domain